MIPALWIPDQWIIEILMAILIGLCFDRAQMGISLANYDALFNGFGAIDLTVKKNIKAPMAYRVLVPFLVVWVERLLKTKPEYRMFIYQAFKAFFVVLAVWSVIHVFGLLVALITFIILLATIQYDYWDWPIELAAVVLAAGGMFVPALLVGILFAFSRETSLITGFVYLAATGDWIGALIITAIIGVILFGIRWFIGKRELYCERFMWKYNLSLFKNFFKWKPFLYSPLFVSSAITIGTVLSVLVMPKYFPALILLLAGWILAKADEPRIFSACIPFIAVLIGVSL